MILQEAQGHEYPYKRKWNKVHDGFNESLKNACFSKQGYNSLIKDWGQWEKIMVSHYII